MECAYHEVEKFMKLALQRCSAHQRWGCVEKRECRELPLNLRSLSNHPTSGSTLIEVIISIGIVVLVLVTIVASGTLVTRNRRFSANQGVATKYSQETIEWVKSFRNEVGWKTFYDSVNAKGVSPITVCMPLIATAAADFDSLTSGNCTGTDVIANTEYQRTLVFTIQSPSEVIVDSKINWLDNAITHETNSRAVLQEWQ